MKSIAARLVTALAVGVVFAGSAAMSPVQAADEKPAEKPKVSKAAAKPLQAAKEALDAKKYDEGIAKLKEVEAMSGKAPYDEHLLHELLGFAYVRTNQFPEASKELEAGLNSGFLEESEVPNRVRALATVNYQIKNYDKAIEFGNRAIKGGYADDDMYTIVGQAFYIKGDFRSTEKFVDEYVDGQLKAGKTPKEQTLQLEMSSCVKLDDAACTTKSLERLVSYYPKTEYWQNLVYSMFQADGQTDKSLLHVYRLASEVDVLKRPEDYTEFAQLAIEAGSPGEAQAILEKAMQKNVFTDARSLDRNKRLLESARTQAKTDQASLDKVAADAANAKTGDKDVSVGLAYIGYKQYAKAVEALNRGLSKPGVQNEAEARLLLGIAELGAGNKDEAQKAFKAVKGNPTLERLANLWSLHARQA